MAANVSIEEALRRGWISKEDVPATALKRGRSKREIEGDEQAELIKLFRMKYPQYTDYLIHTPNGGSRKNAFEGWRLKQQGVRAGVSDLQLPVARGGYFGLWIEFKAAPPNDAAVSAEQKEWVKLMREQGHRAEVCKGVAQAIALLDEYLALPPTPRGRSPHP